MYVFVRINLQMSLILKEVLNNAQELVTGNSSKWHKSMDFSFHTEFQKYLGLLNQSLTHNCKEFWQFLMVSWMPTIYSWSQIIGINWVLVNWRKIGKTSVLLGCLPPGKGWENFTSSAYSTKEYEARNDFKNPLQTASTTFAKNKIKMCVYV